MRDELLERHAHYERQLKMIDAKLEAMREEFPECQALLKLHGIGTFTALVLIAEWGDVTRFRTAKQAAAYTGLTARVEQSGAHCHHGHIIKQGSPWMRWVLIEAAMKIVGHDVALANFYTRIRKRASAKIARVAVARKLAEICWKRLRVGKPNTRQLRRRWPYLYESLRARRRRRDRPENLRLARLCLRRVYERVSLAGE